MNKILIIIQREYLTRVKQKSFIIMTLLGPILMGALMIVPVWLALNDEGQKHIMVVDESQLFFRHLPNTETLNFHYTFNTLEEAKERMKTEDFDALLYIHKNILITAHGIQLFYKKQPGITTLRYIENTIGAEIETMKLAKSGIDERVLKSVKASVKLITTKLDDSGNEEDSHTETSMIVGILGGLLIYMFIFLYGVQVMRGVIEEKTNRIIEVIISSVRPFQLMMGKIVGIALVGLTQFLLWIILTFTVVTAASSFMETTMKKKETTSTKLEQSMSGQITLTPGKSESNADEIKKLWEGVYAINFPLMLGAFLFYFLGGYLLYSALFAAVGSAVDSEADTQQFMLPITIPLIFSFIMAQVVMNNPEGSLAFWLSVCPLTSPVIMMVRLPFGVPTWEFALSLGCLVLGFLAATWLAAKIYRVGILMYGKKITYKELWKWMSY